MAVEGGSAPVVNTREWGLSAADSLRALDALLAEKTRRMGGDEAKAMAWLVAGLLQAKDRGSLSALVGKAVADESLFAKTSEILKQQDNRLWEEFAKASLGQFAVHDSVGGFSWLAELNKDFRKGNDSSGSLELDRLSVSFCSSVVDGLLEDGPESATLAIGKMGATSTDQALLRMTYLEKMAKEDPDGIWETVTKPGVSTEWVKDTITALSDSSPEIAAERLGSSNLVGQERNDTEWNLLNNWSSQSPAEAFRWVSTHRATLGLPSPLTPVFERWARADPMKATTELASMPSGPERDDAIVGMVSGISEASPETIDSWINSIVDPEKREIARSTREKR